MKGILTLNYGNGFDFTDYCFLFWNIFFLLLFFHVGGVNGKVCRGCSWKGTTLFFGKVDSGRENGI